MRGYRPGIIVLLTFILDFIHAKHFGRTAFDYSVAEPLKDGLLVTGGEETRRHVATWTLLVTLDVPVEESGLRNRLLRLRTGITKLHDSLRSTDAVKASWLQRVSDIERTMLTDVPTHARARRGLLNFIGIISNKLFGTATESQVKECRRLLINASVSNRRISHLYNELTSVVNQTHYQVKDNRDHLRNMENYVGQAIIAINKVISHLQSQQKKVSALVAHSFIGQILTAIEAQHNSWLRQLDKYRRQQASLDLGRLTEEILPVSELKRIIAAGLKIGLKAPPVRWYYEHIQIQAMWEDTDKLVFKAELPFSDSINYLRYHLSSWPVYRNSTDTWIMLSVPADVAFHTESGGIFQPHHCLGERPAICHTGPIYDRSTFHCVRGILTNEDELRSHCRVTMAKYVTQGEMVSELSPGVFIIATPGEVFSLLCSGEAEKRLELTAGVYHIPLRANCRMHGHGWVISGIVSRSSSIVLDIPRLHITPFNLSDWVPDQSILKHIRNPT